MGHRHPVADTDAHFRIDAITRNISAVSGKTALIQGDHNSERFTFELARFIDNHDMSLCNSVQIHYINIDAITNKQNRGMYEVQDMKVSPGNEDSVVLTWLISSNATQYAGSLNFVVKFKCVSEDGTVDYVWNSGIFKGISVSNGIDNGEIIAEEYVDILEQWKAEIDSETVIKRIESLDQENMVNLRDIEDGMYILYGYFKPFSGSDSTLIIDNGFYMVTREDDGSHLLNISPLNFKMTCHEILVDDTAENGFTYNNTRINLLDVYESMNGGSRVSEVTLLADGWVGEASPYSQIVAIDGITPYSQVDLTPSVEQLVIFHDKDLAFVTENDDGVVTVYAIGQKPANDYTVQVTITEVNV